MTGHGTGVLFGMLGGLGLFIYGMQLMGDGLQRAAGDRLRRILEALTTNPVMGVLLGACVTALIQSSSATTVIVVGLVNAGIMTIHQAAGVIMGANIGTTVTAQLIAFRLTDYNLPAIGLGLALMLFARSKPLRHIGQITFGFGLLFLGMGIMAGALKPLKDAPIFTRAMVSLGEHPILGVLVGTGFTAVVQSSSATIGVLQALASQGLVSLRAALPILFGDNIGTCVTALLASIGANVNARRAAYLHLLFNVIGTVVFMLALPLVFRAVSLTSTDVVRQIANAHTLFNSVNVLIQLPFIAVLVALATRLAPGEVATVERGFRFVDPRINLTPSLALGQVRKEVVRMADMARLELDEALQAFFRQDMRLVKQAKQREAAVNELNRDLNDFLAKLAQRGLIPEQSDELMDLVAMTSDLERVGDHADNVAELAEYRIDHRLSFSDQAVQELASMHKLVDDTLAKATRALAERDAVVAAQVLDQENHIDQMKYDLRRSHLIRLNEGTCMAGSGVVYLDLIANLERAGDHAASIAHLVRGDR